MDVKALRTPTNIWDPIARQSKYTIEPFSGETEDSEENNYDDESSENEIYSKMSPHPPKPSPRIGQYKQGITEITTNRIDDPRTSYSSNHLSYDPRNPINELYDSEEISFMPMEQTQNMLKNQVGFEALQHLIGSKEDAFTDFLYEQLAGKEVNQQLR